MKANIKLKTFVERLDMYLKEQMELMVSWHIYCNELACHANQFVAKVFDPKIGQTLIFKCPNHTELRLYAVTKLPDRTICNALAKIDVRTECFRKNGTYEYKRLVRTGPGFEYGLQDLSKRRALGLTYNTERTLYLLRKAGYHTPEEVEAEYEHARALTDKLQFIRYRYNELSCDEKQALHTFAKQDENGVKETSE